MRPRALRCLYRVAVLLALAAAVLPAAAEEPVQVIEQAQLTLAAPGASAPTRAVALPYSWDKEQGAVTGQARFDMPFELADPSGPLALYIPRVGSSFTLTLNGREIGRAGKGLADPDTDATNQPRYFDLPPDLLAHHNLLQVGIAAQLARGAGLSPVVLGPRDEVRARFERLRLWQYSGSRVVAIVSVVLGLLALLLWLRRRDPLFLYYGAGEIAWSVQTARVLYEHAPAPWSGLLVTTAFHMAPALLCKFALAAAGRTHGLLFRALDVLVWLAFPAAALWLLGGWLWIGPTWQTLSAVAALAMAVTVVRATWRSKLWEERMLCLAVVVIVGSAVRDIALLRLSRHAFDVLPWTRFAWLGFGVAMAWVIAERMRKDSLALAGLNSTLQQQLQARDAELAAALERERDTHKRSGALEERQRLVRDLHDGLGGHLVGTLRLAQQADVPREALTLQLRDALDQLRVTVDSMHDAEGDVAAALAAVRYRLGPRLQAAGIELAWQVEELPRAAGWGVREAHHLQMLLYEAFSNMIQHSAATQATLTALSTGDQVSIVLQDNGRGFDVDSAGGGRGKGLHNMRQRAAALGAQLALHSASAGVTLSLLLPLSPGPES